MSTTIVHAFRRGESFAFGGFGGVTTGEIDGPVPRRRSRALSRSLQSRRLGLLGGDREEGDDPITGYGAAGTFFLSDNFSLGADVNYYEFYENDAQDGTIYGVNAEYQFGGGPFSIYGGYHISDEDYFGTDKEVNSFTLGGRSISARRRCSSATAAAPACRAQASSTAHKSSAGKAYSLTAKSPGHRPGLFFVHSSAGSAPEG